MTTKQKYESIRDEQGLNDYRVMKLANIEKATFYSWRAKQTSEPDATMSVRNMRKVADALGVTIDALLGDEE